MHKFVLFIILVGLYTLFGWIINKVGSLVFSERFVSPDDPVRRAELIKEWYHYAATWWFIPYQYIISFVIIVSIFAIIGFFLRDQQTSIKVYGLIAERFFGIIYGFGIASIGLQVCLYMLAVCYAQVILFPEIRFTLYIRDALVSLAYAAILISCCAFIVIIFQFTAVRSIVLSWKIIKSLKLNNELNTEMPRSFGIRGGILVISDLHFTSPDRLTLEGGKSSERSLEFLAEAIKRTEPKLIICCGDLTDTGDILSWKLLSDHIKNTKIPFICTPGNHDYHFRSMNRETSPMLEYMLETFFFFPSRMNSYSKEDVLRHINLVSSVSIAGFPFFVKDDGWGADILIFDSNQRISNSPITNAIGQVGNDQLKAAKHLVSTQRDPIKPLIILVHHHISPPKSIGRAARVFLCCLDSNEIFDFAAKNTPAVILHGHLHMPYVRSGQVDILSCGSALFAAKGPYEELLSGKSSAFALSFDKGDAKCSLFIET